MTTTTPTTTPMTTLFTTAPAEIDMKGTIEVNANAAVVDGETVREVQVSESLKTAQAVAYRMNAAECWTRMMLYDLIATRTGNTAFWIAQIK